MKIIYKKRNNQVVTLDAKSMYVSTESLSSKRAKEHKYPVVVIKLMNGDSLQMRLFQIMECIDDAHLDSALIRE